MIDANADQYGNALAINAYDAWGIPNSGNIGRFGYTGQAWLPELGMWYYKARLYSPTLGRFLQTDPVGYKDQINLYLYAGNDPSNITDPSGQEVVSRSDGRRVVLVYPQASYEHLRVRHWPNGTAESRYRWDVTKPQAEKIAGDTLTDALRTGTYGREGNSNVYESMQAPFGGWFTSLGKGGEDYNRLVTASPESLSDPKLKAQVAQELARPEMVASIAAAEKTSPGPIDVEVVLSQYPVPKEKLTYNKKED